MNINEPFNFDTLLITKSGAVNPRVVQSCAFATPSESEFFCTVKSRPISYSISLFHSLRSTLIYFFGGRGPCSLCCISIPETGICPTLLLSTIMWNILAVLRKIWLRIFRVRPFDRTAALRWPPALDRKRQFHYLNSSHAMIESLPRIFLDSSCPKFRLHIIITLVSYGIYFIEDLQHVIAFCR